MLFSLNVHSKERFVILNDTCYLNKVVRFAHTQVGIKETGKNRGKAIDLYNKSVGNPLGSPYCAAGLYYCFYAVDSTKNKLKRTGLANGQFNHYKAKRFKSDYSPKVGDLLVWIKGKTIYGHIEIITKIRKNGWVETIGFNTGINARDGDGVAKKLRHIRNPLQTMVIRGICGNS